MALRKATFGDQVTYPRRAGGEWQGQNQDPDQSPAPERVFPSGYGASQRSSGPGRTAGWYFMLLSTAALLGSSASPLLQLPNSMRTKHVLVLQASVGIAYQPGTPPGLGYAHTPLLTRHLATQDPHLHQAVYTCHFKRGLMSTSLATFKNSPLRSVSFQIYSRIYSGTGAKGLMRLELVWDTCVIRQTLFRGENPYLPSYAYA